MQRQALGCGAIVLTLLAGCGPLGPSWPDGYREAICTATARLHAADAHLAEVLAAVESADSDQVAVNSAGMEREAELAQRALDGAPAWEPGAELTSDIGLAATAFMRAAPRFRTGARQGDGPAYDTAVAEAQSAEAALGRIELDALRLTTSAGWQAC